MKSAPASDWTFARLRMKSASFSAIALATDGIAPLIFSPMIITMTLLLNGNRKHLLFFIKCKFHAISGLGHENDKNLNKSRVFYLKRKHTGESNSQNTETLPKKNWTGALLFKK
jgi:hypothetical protein